MDDIAPKEGLLVGVYACTVAGVQQQCRLQGPMKCAVAQAAASSGLSL